MLGDSQLTFLTRTWFNGGSALPVVARLRDAFLAWASISEIRREVDESLNDDLDRAGVPRV